MLYDIIDSLMANIKNGRIPLALGIIIGSLVPLVRYLIVSVLVAGLLTYASWRFLTKGNHYIRVNNFQILETKASAEARRAQAPAEEAK